MIRLLPVALLGVIVVVAQTTRGDPPRPAAREAGPPAVGLPVGKWKVEFANGVKEGYHIGNGGEFNVEQPERRAHGVAEARGGAVVFRSHDDRIERWTPVGNRYVVEHWFPASQVPIATPVLGIAERAP